MLSKRLGIANVVIPSQSTSFAQPVQTHGATLPYSVVETPADQVMVEQTLSFKGQYFVLMGRISPLDGMGPKEIHFDRLLDRIEKPEFGGPVREVVLATNFTSEGEATAHYIGEILKIKGIKATRIARGIPVGGELEYVDAGTLARALLDRRSIT